MDKGGSTIYLGLTCFCFVVVVVVVVVVKETFQVMFWPAGLFLGPLLA